MKLIIIKFLIISLLVFCIIPNVNQSNLSVATNHKEGFKDSEDAEELPQQSKELIEENLKKIHKVLFMVKLPENQNSKNPLNFVNYKNLVVSNTQVAFFESNKNNVAEKDSSPIINSYIYTMNTADIELPCINRSYVCLYQELLGEYLKLFPEINFNVPKEIVQYFGDKNKMMDKCIVLTNGPAISLDNANWLCHPESNYIKKIQELISKKVRETIKGDTMELFVRYTFQGSTQDGILRLEADKIKFINLQKVVVLDKSYSDVELSAVSLYLKEELPSDVSSLVDDASRCFKITQKNPKLDYYFCVFFKKTDQAMQKQITVIESRWYALFYADYMTYKCQKWSARYSLTQLSKLSTALEIDQAQLTAIKNQVRSDYFIGRHKIVQDYKSLKMSKTQATSELKELKEKIIESACNGIQVCKKAIYYCIDKGLLPLSGNKEKFSMDPQNPYGSIMPSSRLAVKSVVTGKGRDLVNKAAAKKGSMNYWAQHLPAAAKGETPNMTNIKQAFNTMDNMKDKKKYSNIGDFSNNCRQASKNKSNNIKRKVALMNMVPPIDPFLQYLGIVHDKTLGKVN